MIDYVDINQVDVAHVYIDPVDIDQVDVRIDIDHVVIYQVMITHILQLTTLILIMLQSKIGHLIEICARA